MSRKLLFNNGWFFSKHPVGTGYDSVAAGGFEWTPVTLPHDWLIEDSHRLYENGEGWYRKTFSLDEAAADRRTSLRFEGVYMNAAVYVNGQLAGEWKYGYSTFEFDITPFAKPGPNEVHVQVVHESPNSRWYSGAGIYRSVWLKSYPDTHLVADGIYIMAAEQEDGHWSVEVDTELRWGTSAAAAAYSLRHAVLSPAGDEVARAESAVEAAAPGTVSSAPLRLELVQPELWSLEAPSLYRLRTEWIADGVVIETETQTFGLRTLTFDSRRGFFLNGRYVKLHGACQHHDLGSLGAAVNKAALRRQLALLREMGVNAIRTAHNMPAVELMDLADEMGMLIVSEAFDMWERKKTTFDYARFFPEWWRKDIASWVRRDRNRPSLIMWSIGNEIYDTHADERGQELTRLLQEEVWKHDPKGNAKVTIGSNYMPWENAQKCADIVKLAGYNYAERYYDAHHAEHPDWIIYGSETASTVQSRGVYHFPLAQSVLADDDEQCSSLGNSSTSWGAKSTERCIVDDRDAEYSPGQFIWTGFDYIGEPTPFHTKNSYFGQLDTAGFKKDSFYIYQAEWTDYRSKPMVHIFPYWDFSEGQMIDVRVCSNAPRIELFFNGDSLGSFDIDHARGTKLLGEWRIPYAKGTLEAVAYDENGAAIATDVRSSFGDAAAIVLRPDRTRLAADGSDLIFVEISAVDAEGNPVDNANNRIHVAVDGPGRLVGLDNGDSTDYDSYKGTNRRLFGGKLLAIVAATNEPGAVTVRAAARGLAPAELSLASESPAGTRSVGTETLTGTMAGTEVGTKAGTKAETEVGTAWREETAPLFGYVGKPQIGSRATDEELQQDEIPVRKLEIVCPEGNEFGPDRRTLPVRVRLHPADATYPDVEWRVTNAAGIDANIATLAADGTNAVVTALGDGEFYVRCLTANGADKVRLYSQMEFRVAGLGQAYLNPYEFVSGGYCSGEVSANLTNGNERGVATARDGESLIVFEKVDFGDFGSDEITLPIFSLDSEEFPIELWEGVPGLEGATPVDCFTYQKPTIWNTYQEMTYRLPRRLSGVTTIAFLLRRKIHLKGFRFKRTEKAYEPLRALDNDQIYGDTFIRTNETIEQIGNNVSLVYRDMDFGETGSASIVICGESPIDNNTIGIQFAGENGETKQLVEFGRSDGYIEREFALEKVSGPQTVTFVFLPGSHFHFKSFRFLPSERGE